MDEWKINFLDFDPNELELESKILGYINKNPEITTDILSEELKIEITDIIEALERLKGNQIRLAAVNQWIATKRITDVLDTYYNKKIAEIREQDKGNQEK
jgi:hypothetical protein